MPKLTRKQQRFVEEFQVDFNATQAAIRAGYSRRTAKQTGHENLTKPHIAAAVEAERQKLAKAAELDVIEWRKSVAQLARFDIRRVFDEHGNLLPVNKLPDDVAACLSSVKVLRTRTRIEQDEATDQWVVEIKVWDKIRAFEMIGKHLGLLKERFEHGLDPALLARFSTTDLEVLVNAARMLEAAKQKGSAQ